MCKRFYENNFEFLVYTISMSTVATLKRLAHIMYRAVIVAAIAAMAWHIHWLHKDQEFKQLQIDLMTARLNNLKECHLHDDAECPEGKYSNSAEIIEKMKASAGSWF